MEFKDYFVMFLIVGLFILCLVSFGINLSTENNANVNLNQNPILNKLVGNVSKELNNSMSNTEGVKSALFQETGQQTILTSIGFYLKSIFYAGKVFFDMGTNMIGFFFIFIQETLNIPPIITGTLMAILVGVLVLAVWSVYRAGR